jgi:acyl dehydratase
MSTLSALLEVTQERIDAYGRANGDGERMHYDAAYARSRGFRGTIAHGTMLAAPLVDLALRRYGAGFLSSGTLAIRWVSPVCAGDLQVATIDEDGKIEAVNDRLAGRPVTIRGQATCGVTDA